MNLDFSEDAIRRYSRHILLPEVGEHGQEKLLKSRVLLLGAGGLGSPAALYLGAAGVGADAVRPVGLPLGGVEVEQRRLEALDQAAADVEEAGAARAAEELAAGGGEHVAADLVDIDRHLPDRLAGIEEVGNAVGAGHRTHLGRRIDQPAIGRDRGDGDQR